MIRLPAYVGVNFPLRLRFDLALPSQNKETD
jgi:hypothetical protein